MTSFLRPRQPPRLGNPLRARAGANVLLTMCGDVTQCCVNVLLFITRREMEAQFPGTERNTFSLFSPDQRAMLQMQSDPASARRCAYVVWEEYLAGKWLMEQSDEQHSDMFLMSRGQDQGWRRAEEKKGWWCKTVSQTASVWRWRQFSLSFY